MKALYLFKILLVVVICSSFMKADTTADVSKADLSVSQTVYICGGKYATKFHSTSKCSGLNNCKGGIYKYDSQEEAMDEGYSHCKICWK
jgi:hypothetical protein